MEAKIKLTPIEIVERDEPYVRREIDKLKRKIDKFNPLFWKHYKLPLTKRFKVNNLNLSSQAKTFDVSRYTLHRILRAPIGCRPETRARLAEATGTSEALWAKGGDVVERRKALDAVASIQGVD
jgi:hypothetical protein